MTATKPTAAQSVKKIIHLFYHTTNMQISKFIVTLALFSVNSCLLSSEQSSTTELPIELYTMPVPPLTSDEKCSQDIDKHMQRIEKSHKKWLADNNIDPKKYDEFAQQHPLYPAPAKIGCAIS